MVGGNCIGTLEVTLSAFLCREYSFPFSLKGAARKSSVNLLSGVTSHSSVVRVSLVRNLMVGWAAFRESPSCSSLGGRIQVGRIFLVRVAGLSG